MQTRGPRPKTRKQPKVLGQRAWDGWEPTRREGEPARGQDGPRPSPEEAHEQRLGAPAEAAPSLGRGGDEGRHGRLPPWPGKETDVKSPKPITNGRESRLQAKDEAGLLRKPFCSWFWVCFSLFQHQQDRRAKPSLFFFPFFSLLLH